MTQHDDPTPPDTQPTPNSQASLPTDAPRWLCLGLPIFTCALLIVAPLALGMNLERYDRVMLHEIGVLELATVVFLLVAIGFAAPAWKRRRSMPNIMTAVIVLGALGAFFFAGEESSWGQWY
ncbi:MAG: hypothetical protein ACYTGQ_03420, partial [Planctomycetota bacterium]